MTADARAAMVVSLPRDLGGGLLLRRTRLEDAAPLATFLGDIFGEGPDQPDEEAAAWGSDLLRGDHPTGVPADSTVVVDTRRDRIVSSCLLIPQTWTYEGIPFGVGRPELVATDPAYRRRGLIRAQFAALHDRSAALGHRMQALTGIPYFYRQFGYEPALLIDPARLGYPTAIAELGPGEAEPYRLRPAREADLPLVVELYERALARALIAAVRGEEIWRYELFGRDPRSDYWHELRVVERPDGAAVGFLAHLGRLRGGRLLATVYELRDGVPWHEVTPSVLRYLRTTGAAIAARDGGRFVAFGIGWTDGHPIGRVAGALLPDRTKPFPWHVRVADLPAFLRHVAPVVERRLAASPLAGYSGEVRLTFYRDGLRLRFGDGRLLAVDPLGSIPLRAADAGFPDRTFLFLFLLLGSRTLDELEQAFPAECWVRRDEMRALLATIFPKRSSAVWPIA